VIVELDKNENARAEFEFAGGKQVDNFFRAAIRRPYEKGAILATRTYTDESGKHKIIAALIAMTDSELRLQRGDGSEKDVPPSDQQPMRTNRGTCWYTCIQ